MPRYGYIGYDKCGYNKCGCKALNTEYYTKDPIYEAIVAGVYDNNCCNLVKRAFSFYTDKANCITRSALRALEASACKGCISRRAYEIKFAL